MSDTCRESLLKVLARLDQSLAAADAILAKPGDVEKMVHTQQMRLRLIHMQARVEAKLETLAGE